jgi:ferredoxin-type protein NapG
MSGKLSARRSFLVRLGQGTALAASAGFVWAFVLRNQARATPYALRPPGALPEAEFHARCIKCGQCVNACPFDTLRLATAWESRPIGSPYFIPRETPCYLCEDIPCKAACPTGALSPGLEQIRDARMGLAVIDEENCLSWQGLRCEVCFRNCPLEGKAITVATGTRETGHASFVQRVHSAHCTGCGICENTCPTAVPAIRVLDPALVQGRMAEHYQLRGAAGGGMLSAPVDPQSLGALGPGRRVPGLDALNQDDLP